MSTTFRFGRSVIIEEVYAVEMSENMPSNVTKEGKMQSWK